jgi:large subunit ribosomal protein L17
MALIEFVGAEDPGYKKRGRRGPAQKAEKTEAAAPATTGASAPAAGVPAPAAPSDGASEKAEGGKKA